MCTIFVAYKMHPKYDLIYLGNRDEFKERKTSVSQFYDQILMGKDLKKGGTWMGITKTGKFTCLTNYRDMHLEKEFETSRGQITLDYLMSSKSPLDYIKQLRLTKQSYKGYNILLGDVNGLYYYSNINDDPQTLEPGVYGLSNHFLNTPWYKVSRGKKQLTDLLYDEILDVESLFSILDDTTTAELGQLPDTGLDINLEQSLSSMHIDLETYGTVFKQVILINKQGHVAYFEKTIRDHFLNTHKIVFDLE